MSQFTILCLSSTTGELYPCSFRVQPQHCPFQPGTEIMPPTSFQILWKADVPHGHSHRPSSRTPSHFCSFPCCRAGSIGQILKSDLAFKDFRSLTLSISGLYVCILPGKQDSCPTEALTLTAIGMILLNIAIIALELRVEAQIHQIHPHKDEDCPSEKIKCNPGFEQHLKSSKLCLWVRWERSWERSLT